MRAAPRPRWVYKRERGFWDLMLGNELVGETYPVDSGFRYHCKLDDWREVCPTLSDAKCECARRVGAQLERRRTTGMDEVAEAFAKMREDARARR